MSASVHCPAPQFFHIITFQVSFKIKQTKLPLKVVKSHHFDMELGKTLLKKNVCICTLSCTTNFSYHNTSGVFQNLTGIATLENREDFIILICNLVKLCLRKMSGSKLSDNMWCSKRLENIILKTFYMFFIYKKQINYNVQLLAEKVSNINLCHELLELSLGFTLLNTNMLNQVPSVEQGC